MNSNIQSHLEKVKLTLKNELVNDVIVEVLNSIKRNPISYDRNYEKGVIKSLSQLKFDND